MTSMETFVHELISLAKKDLGLAYEFIDENITKVDISKLLRAVIKNKDKIERSLFCYLLMQIALYINPFSDDAFRLKEIASLYCAKALKKIMDALRFNLVSRVKSDLSLELWEMLGPRLSLIHI